MLLNSKERYNTLPEMKGWWVFIKRYNCLYHNLWIESMPCCRCIPVPRCQSDTYFDHFESSSTPLLIFTLHWDSREDTLNICHIFQKTRLTCPCPGKPRKPDHNDGYVSRQGVGQHLLETSGMEVWRLGDGVYWKSLKAGGAPKPWKNGYLDTLVVLY